MVARFPAFLRYRYQGTFLCDFSMVTTPLAPLANSIPSLFKTTCLAEWQCSPLLKSSLDRQRLSTGATLEYTLYRLQYLILGL
jgi:hypothetical protein